MTDALNQKGQAFFDMHHAAAPFIIPNPWDVGSARMLEQKGFQALATSSAGFVFSLGRREGTLSLDDVLAHCRSLAASVAIPISADLEDGYGETLDEVRQTYFRAGETGLVGGSIEDAAIAATEPLYDFAEAVARVEAAVDAVRSLPFKFTLTARAENYLYGNPDLQDTIKRLQAFQGAGADVLYAPGLKSLDDVKAVTSSVDLPVNVVVGLPGTQFTVAELAEAGVKRISVGSGLFRAAFTTAMQAADEMLHDGSFTFAATAKGFGEINGLFPEE